MVVYYVVYSMVNESWQAKYQSGLVTYYVVREQYMAQSF